MERKPKNYWTEDKIIELAQQFNTSAEFRKNAQSVFLKARKLGIMDKVCQHMSVKHRPKGQWTKERLLAIAKEYGSRSAFKKGDPAAYSATLRSVFKDEVLSVIPSREIKPRNYWNIENLTADAQKYESLSAWRKNSTGAWAAWNAAEKTPEMVQVAAHLKRYQKS